MESGLDDTGGSGGAEGYRWAIVTGTCTRSLLLPWICVLMAGSGWAQITVSGRVLDERGSPVAEAQLSLSSVSDHKVLTTTSTDSTAAFRLSIELPGDYLLNASKEGFFQLKDYRLTATESDAGLLLTMNPLREVFQSLDVKGTPSPVDLDRSGTEERLSGTNVNDIPFPATDSLRNALRLMPGTVQDSQGRLHFQGGTEWQTSYLLEGFLINDPIDGSFTTRVGVEGIQGVQFLGGNFSPEYGNGSAGVLHISTDAGTNTLRYSATNFVPGVDTQHTLHIGDWSPRAAVSGPLIRNRAWFSDDMDGTYSQAYVPGQPDGANFSHQWSVSNLFHTQWNLTSSNILFTDFLLNFQSFAFAGLGPLTPVSATQNQNYRQWLAGVKDQQTFAGKFVVEIGFAQQSVLRHIVPQGDQPYAITPLGDQGNYFVNSRQTGRRDQFLLNAYLPVRRQLGTHDIKFGAEAFDTRYDGLFQRTSYEYLGLEGQLLSRTTFAGTGQFTVPEVQTGLYAMDQWKPWERVLITLGVREDWDELIRRSTWSPRISVSASPFSLRRTRISAGFAVTMDASNLQQFSQARDQVSISTQYDANGLPTGLPSAQLYTVPHSLAAPKYNNWTVGLHQDLKHNLFFNATYLSKRGNHGLTYVSAPLSNAALEGSVQDLVGMPVNLQEYLLTNLRRDRYDSAEFTLRQTFVGQFEWMASYVRSQAVSTAVFGQSIDLPLNVQNNFGPLPWDAPNRFLGWAYFPLPWKKWSIASLIDLRSGFPYSVQDAAGNIIGAADSNRFPLNFDLNLHIERRFEFRGHRFALRVGVNNLTDHKNPTAVYNTVGSRYFGQFLGDEGRHVVLRIRFFGRGK